MNKHHSSSNNYEKSSFFVAKMIEGREARGLAQCRAVGVTPGIVLMVVQDPDPIAHLLCAFPVAFLVILGDIVSSIVLSSQTEKTKSSGGCGEDLARARARWAGDAHARRPRGDSLGARRLSRRPRRVRPFFFPARLSRARFAST